MLRNLLERLTAAAKALGRLRAEIADLQQHLVPAAILALAAGAQAGPWI
jgi:hypothetical protein